jgi:hypothetical protein
MTATRAHGHRDGHAAQQRLHQGAVVDVQDVDGHAGRARDRAREGHRGDQRDAEGDQDDDVVQLRHDQVAAAVGVLAEHRPDRLAQRVHPGGADPEHAGQAEQADAVLGVGDLVDVDLAGARPDQAGQRVADPALDVVVGLGEPLDDVTEAGEAERDQREQRQEGEVRDGAGLPDPAPAVVPLVRPDAVVEHRPAGAREGEVGLRPLPHRPQGAHGSYADSSGAAGPGSGVAGTAPPNV